MRKRESYSKERQRKKEGEKKRERKRERKERGKERDKKRERKRDTYTRRFLGHLEGKKTVFPFLDVKIEKIESCIFGSSCKARL